MIPGSLARRYARALIGLAQSPVQRDKLAKDLDAFAALCRSPDANGLLVLTVLASERYPAVERVAWVQEEPRNMGARKFVLPKIRHLVPFRIPLGDVSRPERSRPAEGYPAAHLVEQARIVREALTS